MSEHGESDEQESAHLGECAFGKHDQQAGLRNCNGCGIGISRQPASSSVWLTFPQAPSPTMTSFLRISDMDFALVDVYKNLDGWCSVER